jgi:N-methylhydantoinase A
MVNAIKLVSVERGLDPRDFTLVGFGGAGPLHVASLADALGIRSVLVPPAPGNTSASGLLCAEPRQDLVRTVVRRLDELPAGLIDEIVDDLVRDAAGLLRGEGVEAAQQTHVLSADLRYAGQSHDLGIPFARDDARSAFAPLVERFRARHRALYGYDLSDRPVELVNVRVSAYGPKRALPWPERPLHAGGAPSPSGRRDVLFRAGDGREAWPVYRFDALAPGARIDGPAIVEYPGSTLVVPPGWGARCDRWRNLILAKP